MAGSSHGLGDISHTGQMRLVGGKAASFMHKKFFHPSTMQNQEKIWQGMEAASSAKRKEIELCKRREEELAVERLKKDMYLAGQGGKSDAALFKKDGEKEVDEQVLEAQELADEQRRRKAMLRRGRDGEMSDDDGDRELAHSCYEEDQFSNGHWSVWGSWYDSEKKCWGFRCCKSLSKEGECPKAAEAPLPNPLQTRGKKKLDPLAKRARTDVTEQMRADQKAKEEYEFQLKCDDSRYIFGGRQEEKKLDPAKFMAPELLLEIQKKEETKRKKAEEEKNSKAAGDGSVYLADLLADPLAL